MSGYRSTRSGGVTASLSEAIFQGPAPDGGLYIPSVVPQVDAARIARESTSFAETARRMAIALLGHEVPPALLEEIVAEALDFPVPLVPIGDGLHVLELFHGPTAAFKDVGARFMASLMERLDPEPERARLVLVATSGDTGGAVADAFVRLPRFKVVVLFPEHGVTDEQRRLFTTLGGNVTAVAVKGTFDTCQALVKSAFRSGESRRLALTAANSINIGRLIAALAGLPVAKLVAALNANDVFLRHLRTGSAGRQETRKTLSSAMDVGDPSNLERLSALTGMSLDELRRWFWSASFDDDQTVATMARAHRERGYLFDPHGAVGMLGAEAYREHARTDAPTVVLATADPAKLPDIVEAATGVRPRVPAAIARALREEERTVPLGDDLPGLLELLDEVAGGRMVAR